MNEKNEMKEFLRMDSKLVYLLLIFLLIITGSVFYREYTAEWKRYQKEFRELLGQKFGEKAKKDFTIEIQQIWLKDINRIDRCTTCHLGVEYEKLNSDDVPRVFRYHPLPNLIKAHPFKVFGCTLCHGGKGLALSRDEAHYTKEKGWLEFFFSTKLAEEYKFPDARRMPLMEINCNACHIYDKEIRWTEEANGKTVVYETKYINLGKKLFEEKLCTCCHNFRGKGGLVGPDLSYEGDKPPDKYDFSAIKDWKEMKPSVFSWHYFHFKYPYFVSLNTLMPNFNFKDEEIRALTMLVLSYKTMPQILMHDKFKKEQIKLTEVQK